MADFAEASWDVDFGMNMPEDVYRDLKTPAAFLTAR